MTSQENIVRGKKSFWSLEKRIWWLMVSNALLKCTNSTRIAVTASFSQQTEDRAFCPVVQLLWLRASHCTDYHVTSLLFLRVTCPCSLRTYATLKFIRSSSSSSSSLKRCKRTDNSAETKKKKCPRVPNWMWLKSCGPGLQGTESLSRWLDPAFPDRSAGTYGVRDCRGIRIFVNFSCRCKFGRRSSSGGRVLNPGVRQRYYYYFF